jgi:hypothetical protein
LSLFFSLFYGSSPVVLDRWATRANAAFRAATSTDALLQQFDDTPVTLAAANSYSHKRVTMRFGNYLRREQQRPASAEEEAQDSFYFFGDHDDCDAGAGYSGGDDEQAAAWGPLLCQYAPPPPALFIPQLTRAARSGGRAAVVAAAREFDWEHPSLRRDHTRLSFGVGGHRSGVPLHFHGETFAETLHGRKRWVLFPPRPRAYDVQRAAAMSSLQWILHELPRLTDAERSDMQACTLGPGETIYFPDNYFHSTANDAHGAGADGVAVFISTFINTMVLH